MVGKHPPSSQPDEAVLRRKQLPDRQFQEADGKVSSDFRPFGILDAAEAHACFAVSGKNLI